LKEAKDIDALEDAIRDNNVVVIFWGDSSSEGFAEFERVTKSGFDEVEFVFIKDKEAHEKYRQGG